MNDDILKTKEELISVIVPIYNSEKHLSYCLESILNQTYKNLEIILINDGSLDSSLSICNDFSKKDGRIRVYNKRNEGLPLTRKFGIEKATGSYILFVDSDDYIDKLLCEKCIKEFKKSNCDFVWFNFFVANGKNIKMVDLFSESKSIKQEDALLMTSKQESTDYLWSKMFKIDCFKNISFPVFNMYEDAYTFIQVLLNTTSINLLNERLYYYVMHDNNMSTNLTIEKVKGGIENLKFKFEKLKNTSLNLGNLYANQFADLFFHIALKFDYKKYRYIRNLVNDVLQENNCKCSKLIILFYLKLNFLSYICFKPLIYLKKLMRMGG